MEKLRSNYRLADLLVRIIFVLTYGFAKWRESSILIGQLVTGTNEWLVMLFCILASIFVMFLVPFVVNAVLNVAKLYNIPRGEYCLLVLVAMSLYYLLNGIFGLVNLFTPLMIVWIGTLAPFVSLLICAVTFYKVTASMYFNDVSRVYYFKVCGITTLIIFGVMLLVGGGV